MRGEGDGRRLKERRRKRSHTNPFGRELRVNYSSFVFYLDTTVWERGSSKARQTLIDAVGPEGFTHSADGARGARGRGANGARNWGRLPNGYFGWHRNCKNRDTEGGGGDVASTSVLVWINRSERCFMVRTGFSPQPLIPDS